jgi:trk system potassium uptake protein TrkA
MKSILVIGLGRFGRHITRKFLEEGNSVLAVEKNEGRADNAINILPDIQIADATNETFIKSLGVNNFDLCVVAIGDNLRSLFC